MSLVIERGGDGWISARDGDGPVAYLRCERDQDGRAVVRRLFLRGDGPITAATLRAIPLGRIEALLNDPQVPLRRSGDAGLIDFDPPVGEPPDLDVPFTSTDGATFDRRSTRGSQVLVGLQLSDTGSARDDLVVTKQDEGRLSRPGALRGSHGDAFYQRVAQRYRDVMSETARPAVVLAEEASVPVTTVHRWVREARRRGFLPPGRQGKAG